MNNNLFKDITKEDVDLIESTSLLAEQEDLNYQREKIALESPYSSEINLSFFGYEEYKLLRSLNLREALVTRTALIREIDFNLYISNKQKTNYELMLEGKSPYLSDNENDCIVLHHIGQDFNSPFAELTVFEHSQLGNSKKLHNTRIESWRNEQNKINNFQNERNLYWKKRAKGEITYIKKAKKKDVVVSKNNNSKSVIIKIKQALETLLSACNIDDLNYISNLVNGYILTKQIGGKSIEDFVLNLRKTEGDVTSCPKCQSQQYSHYGYQETLNEKKQRYICKNCGNVFSLFHNTIISGCTLSFIQWIQFIDCLYNGFSLEKTANLCNISIQAAFDNRLRLFYALKLLEQKVVLEGNIAIDETYILVSYKGNRSKQTKFELSRPSRKRGKENHKSGTSKEQICIVCAIDDNNNSIAKIAGLGAPTAKKLNVTLKDNINKDNIVSLYSDKSKAIKKFAEINSYPIQQSVLRRKSLNTNDKLTKTYIQKINSYHSRLNKFISSFNGVSSELIEGYMCLFSWKDRNRNKDLINAYKELLSILVTPNLHKTIEEILLEKIIMSANDIEASFKRPKNKTDKRKLEIYQRWCQGETMQQIADSMGLSRQYIHQIIVKVRKSGFAIKTLKEIKKEKEAIEKQTHNKKFEKTQETFNRNYAIYIEKQNWYGSNKSFYEMATKKYGLSIISIKNRISDVKRILSLRKKFYVYEEYKYLSLKEIFELIYKRYNEIRTLRPQCSLKECYKIIANEFGYAAHTIQLIIQKMNNDDVDWDNKKKMKTPKSQILNRDISIFIDFMKWTGTRKDFYNFTKEKYGTTKSSTQKILQMNYLADPERFEITNN